METVRTVAEFPTNGRVDNCNDDHGDDGIIEFRCDVCRIATFPTFEEAFDHEQTCTNSPPPILVAPVRASSVRAGVASVPKSDPLLVPVPSSHSSTNGTKSMDQPILPESTLNATAIPTPPSASTVLSTTTTTTTLDRNNSNNNDARHNTIRFAPKCATKSCITFLTTKKVDVTNGGSSMKPLSTTTMHQTMTHTSDPGKANPYHHDDDDITATPTTPTTNSAAARMPTDDSNLTTGSSLLGNSNVWNDTSTINARRKKTPKKSTTASPPTMSTTDPATAATTLSPTSPSGSNIMVAFNEAAATHSLPTTTKARGGSNAKNRKPKAASRPLKATATQAPVGAPKHILLATPTISQEKLDTGNTTVDARSSPTTVSNRNAFVGQRVYAQFPGNSMYYWGIITKVSSASLPSVEKQNPASNGVVPPITYQVWFDDEDVADGISGKDMITEEEYLTKWLQTYDNLPPPERPRHLIEYNLDDNGNIIVQTTSSSENGGEGTNVSPVAKPKTPVDLFLEKCGTCLLCVRPECGKCMTCVRAGKNPSEPRGVCFRKMCLEVDVEEKAQPAVGFPYGWRFYFQSTDATSTVVTLPIGLVLISPSGKSFDLLDAAFRRHRKSFERKVNLKIDFFNHIGEGCAEESIEQRNGKRKVVPPQTKKRRRVSDEKSKSASSLKKRTLSATKEVGSRVFCKFTNGEYYWGEISDRKEDESGNVTYAVQFDDGDFLDGIADTSDDHPDGNIYTEAGFLKSSKKYPPKRQSMSVPPASKRMKVVQPQTLLLQNDKNGQVGYTLAELYRKRCKKCSACKKEDCMRCNSCTNNRNGFVEETECCVWKMCGFINKDLKKQPAPGFPPGWMFATGTGHILTIIAPCGDEFHSFEQALNRCRGEIQDAKAAQVEFETHVGGSLLWNDDGHFLVGKEYYHEWTDADGRKKVIYGSITGCERDKLDKDYLWFTVTYNDESFDDIVKSKPSYELDFKPIKRMSLEWALGGYLAYASKHGSSLLKDSAVSSSVRRWLTPDMRIEDVVPGPGGKEMPRLTLVWNGFRLVFSVRQSTILNAGLGVFVQCTSLVPLRTSLKLRKGEMLDLGVYAPLRKEDLKEECVFLVKNFIMGLKCEEWTFDAGQTPASHQLDITDDWTGELHEIAARRILPYMNECKVKDNPSVYAAHDPEGVLHYMLDARVSDLTLPADGSMVELFINYGPKYERIRIRRNYSFLPAAEQLSHAKSVHQENAEYLEEISGYQGPEVTCCVEFVSKIVKTGALPDEFLLNALCSSGLAPSWEDVIG
ncbi:hypothetical protein MHU86_13526 [Fragilaria crotonensis]|nr:hypothetical protein MHU86_13526 [Fragilaria crotonensis]